jgi:hypothetical protein
LVLAHSPPMHAPATSHRPPATATKGDLAEMLQSALRGTRRQTINQAARVATAPTGGDSTSARRSSQVGTRPCAPCPSRRARAHHTSAHSCPCRTKIRHQGSPPLPPSLPRVPWARARACANSIRGRRRAVDTESSPRASSVMAIKHRTM